MPEHPLSDSRGCELRAYDPAVDEFARDGYPTAWHRCPACLGIGWVCAATEGPCSPLAACCVPNGTCPSSNGCPACFVPGGCGGSGSIKQMVREQAGHRCVRCRHPYRVRAGLGRWSPCDEQCRHFGPFRHQLGDGTWVNHDRFKISPYVFTRNGVPTEAEYRILTVHHLDGSKANCRWWNLAALCQRCHLEIQGRVVMDRVWPHEHSDWFKPYVAGYYAWRYLGLEIDRQEAEQREDELLGLEVRQLPLEAT